MASATNPWAEIYRLAAGERKQAAQITTLRKPDGTLTTNLHETLTHMIRYFTPEDNQNDDNEYPKQLRAQTQESIGTPDDKEFTEQEIKNAVASMRNNKAQREDGLTKYIYTYIHTYIHTYTHMHTCPWKNEIIPTPIEDNRVTSMSLCQR